MNIKTIRVALATALRTIDGLNVHDSVPNTIQVLPAAVVFSPEEIAYNETMVTAQRTLSRITFHVAFLCGRQDAAGTQNLLDEYTSDEGTRSVPLALNADRTLGGVINSLRVVRTITGAGNYQNGAETLLGALFEISIYA